MCPPRSVELSVITAAPHQMMTKVPVKTVPVCSDGAVILRMLSVGISSWGVGKSVRQRDESDGEREGDREITDNHHQISQGIHGKRQTQQQWSP